MASTMEMKAFEEQINLSLLSDIIAFVVDTIKADYTQKENLRRRCILLNYDVKSEDFQKKYGFLYLGELLERYEERFGMSVQDRRAIALALGYTRDVTTKEMFVGNQRNAFLQEVRRHADEDVYLTGALYLLNEGQRGEMDWLERLCGLGQEKTETLIFTMSLFPDFEQAFLRFKSQLLHLLGNGRTMALYGNMQILSGLIGNLRPVIKAMRGNSLTLLRALCALPVSFVKEDSKYHKVLLEHGYTAFEIAYANIMAIRCRAAPNALNSNSIVTEKIVVDLFRRVFAQDCACAEEIYPLLSELFTQYKEFSIRCYGESGLLDVLDEGPSIQNADTFSWFTNHAPLSHPAFAAFNILECRWDGLAKGISDEKYLELFEKGLNGSMDKAVIQDHIDRYDTLTGGNYLSLYRKESSCRRFSLMIEKGIFDLWAEFCGCLDEKGVICRPEMLDYIKSYIRGWKTEQAFHFYEQFLPRYGLDGYQKYLKPRDIRFTEGLLDWESYYKRVNRITLERSYLKGNPQGTGILLYWLEEYLFRYEPATYISFICKLLQSETTKALLPQAGLRGLFDLVIDQTELGAYEIITLKQTYWTQEELQAEEAAKRAASLEKEKNRKLQLSQDIKARYEKDVDGTLVSLRKYMSVHHSTDEERSLTYQVVYEKLPQLLAEKQFILERGEADHLLYICAELASKKIMRFTEAQAHISKIKEVAAYDAGNDTSK